MAARKNMGRIEIYRQKNTVVLNMGDIEIWDGADLSLLRDALVHVISKKNAKSVTIDMTFVKYVPSGFFGMLYDWFEKGIEICLIDPQSHVQNMLWFKRFFINDKTSNFKLYAGPEEPFIPQSEDLEDDDSEMLMEEMPNRIQSHEHALSRSN
jgi:anti-anti-sigma regulatory factor